MKNYIYSTGRRKTSSARVFIYSGEGKVFVNKLKFEKYFVSEMNRLIVLKPFKIVGDVVLKDIDIYVTVSGGGICGQASAICHGISRSLIKYNNDFSFLLKSNGLITRDSRKVERKKFGFKKSRRKPQFSKR